MTDTVDESGARRDEILRRMLATPVAIGQELGKQIARGLAGESRHITVRPRLARVGSCVALRPAGSSTICRRSCETRVSCPRSFACSV